MSLELEYEPPTLTEAIEFAISTLRNTTDEELALVGHFSSNKTIVNEECDLARFRVRLAQQGNNTKDKFWMRRA